MVPPQSQSCSMVPVRNILEIPMLNELNKVFKDNPIFVSSLLYFVPTPPFILTPPRLTIFQNP